MSGPLTVSAHRERRVETNRAASCLNIEQPSQAIREVTCMSETLSLPVLPLDDTVVLPTMVVPVDISGAEVRAAIEAARLSAGTTGRRQAAGAAGAPAGRQVLAGRHARRRRADRPAAQRRAGRGDPRPVPGQDRHRDRRPGRRTVGRGHRSRTSRRPARAPRSWPASTAGWPRRSCRSAARGRSSTSCSGITDPSALADSAGYASYLSLEQRTRAAGDHRPGAAARAAGRLGPRHARRAGRGRDDPERRPRGHGEAAARVPAAPAAGRHPQGAGRAGRRAGHRGRGLPGPDRGRRPAGEGRARRRSRRRPSWSAASDSLAGGGLDPDLAGHGAGDPVERRGPTTPTTSPAAGRSWTPTTPGWTTSRTGSSSTWRCASGARTRA